MGAVRRIPPYVPCGDRDPARERALYRETMGREPGPPVPLGCTLALGRLTVHLNVVDGQLPKGLRLAHLLRTPRRRARSRPGFSRAADPAWQQREYSERMGHLAAAA